MEKKARLYRMMSQKYTFFVAFSTSSFPVMDTINPEI